MNKKSILILGDVIAIALLTVIGFATHGEAGSSFLPRMAAAFFPITIAWFMLAPWLGLFDENVIVNPKNLLRIPLVLLFAAPFAVILRAALLDVQGIPIFALVFGTTNTVGLISWRWIYIFIAKKVAN